MERYEVRKINKNVKVRDLIINIDENIKYDTINNEEVFDIELDSKNLINSYNKYREIKKYLFPEDIKLLRSKYALTPEEFSIILGFNKKAIRRFENGSLQKDEEDEILKRATNREFVLIKLMENSESFSPERFNEIKKEITRSNIKYIKSDLQYIQSFSNYLYSDKNSNIAKRIYSIAS